MNPLSRLFKDAKPQEAAMLPGNRFFVRRLTVEGEDVPGQVNLALEAISPFPLEQMLVGFVTSADGKGGWVKSTELEPIWGGALPVNLDQPRAP